MSFKEFSSALNAPAEKKPDDKSKGGPAAVHTPAQPEKTRGEAAPAPKSSQRS